MRKVIATNKLRQLIAFTLSVLSATSINAAGVLTVNVKDAQTGEPIAVRIVLIGPRGREVPVRRAIPAGVGWAFDGNVELEVPSGNYQFQMIRGPEYRVMTGNFQIDRTAEDAHTVELSRFVDTEKETWLAGDLLVDWKVRDLPLLMRSEDLDVIALATGRTDGKKTKSQRNQKVEGELPGGMDITLGNALDQREGSGLLAIGTSSAIEDIDKNAPSGLLIRDAGRLGAKLVVQNPFAWDLPIWLASDKVDGFMLMGDFLVLDREQKKVMRGRAPGANKYNFPKGLGFWASDIYKNMLEAGFRIPPVAGSGAGLVKNPVGYNRVYVQCDDEPSSENFWIGLWQGKSTVTNGPLLRPRLDGRYPGHVFTGYRDQPLQLQMDLQLGTRDPVDYLEVISNGDVIYTARLEEFKDDGGIIPPFTFKESGWVMVRVVTQYEKHYRAAVSAPWYVEIPEKPRVSRKAVAFFQAWLSEREAMLKGKSPEYIQQVAPFIRASRQFWAERMQMATVD